MLASSACASADTLFLGSYGTFTGSGSLAVNPGFGNGATAYSSAESGSQTGIIQPHAGSSDTYDLKADSRWTGPMSVGGLTSSYVSLDPGTTGGVVEPNGTYVYHSYFSSPSASMMTGSLSVLADDTLDVFLNGQQIVVNGEFAGNSYALCSDGGPNCRVPTTVSLDGLVSSPNTVNDLEFVVHQDGLASTGLDFVGFISSVPEPSTLALLAAGLFGAPGALAGRMRRP